MTVRELRHMLHTMPEPSMAEMKTKKTLMDFIQTESDFTLVDCGSWFYAWKKAEHPTKAAIAFRADMDAVCIDGSRPGHYCGHDGHSSILAGFAQQLLGKKVDRDIYLIFQPGEETGEGAMNFQMLFWKKGLQFFLHLRKVNKQRKNRKKAFLYASAALPACNTASNCFALICTPADTVLAFGASLSSKLLA